MRGFKAMLPNERSFFLICYNETRISNIKGNIGVRFWDIVHEDMHEVGIDEWLIVLVSRLGLVNLSPFGK